MIRLERGLVQLDLTPGEECIVVEVAAQLCLASAQGLPGPHLDIARVTTVFTGGKEPLKVVISLCEMKR